MHPLLVVATLLAMQLVESIEVRVVNVDVVVTDREGKPVTGLTAKDFEVLEEGKAQPISNFYEVRGGSPAQDAPGEAGGAPAPQLKARSFILFVDNRTMHPVLRKHVTDELRTFVNDVLQPGDQASVITWDRRLNILAPLTTDKAAVHAAIETVAGTGSPASTNSDFQRVQQLCTGALNMAKGGRMPFKMAYDECIGHARIEAQRLTTYSRLMLNALEVAMSTVAGIEGKKVLVLAGTELPVKPGQDMFTWANGTFGPYMTGFDAAIARPPDEDRTQRELLDKIGRSANAHGVTLYMVSALMPTNTMSTQSATGIIDAGADFMRSSNTEVAHETLARLTGGAAAPIARLRPFLETIQRDLGSYYSLGYKPTRDVKGDRPVTVRAKNRAYTVRARQSYAPRTFDEQMTDRVIANVFTPSRENEWAVQLRTGKPELVEKGRYSVPIEIIAPATNVTLLPRDGKLVGGFTVYVAVGNPQGALSTTFRQPNSIEITTAEEAGFRKTPLVFGANLTLREGENLLSVGVVDQISNTMGFARTTVTTAPSK
jgi:VWFA-related protein